MVERVIFHNERNGFAVLRCRTRESFEPFTAAGKLPGARPGAALLLTGDWTAHPKYGRQFGVSAAEELPPDAPGSQAPSAARMPGGRFVCFDVETPNSLNGRMSAIGITVVENGAVAEEFFSYVDPEEKFDRFNTELTGISAETVKDAPVFGDLWPRIEPLMSGGVLAAHFARFDMTVLTQCLRAYGIPWKDRVPYVCTVTIGRKYLPHMSHRLNDMCLYYGIGLNHHRADSDSRACAEILIRYMRSGIDPADHVKMWPM